VSKVSNYRIHIAAIGHDPIERILLPLKLRRADKVYLITKEGSDMFAHHVKRLAIQIKSQKNIPPIDLTILKCNIYDFTEMMGIIAGIFGKEQALGNHVYYNVSTGGSLSAIIGTLSCMLFGGTPYFVQMDFETNSIPIPEQLVQIPQYSIDRPPRNFITLLFLIHNYQTQHDDKPIHKRDILEMVAQIDDDLPESELFSNPINTKYYNLLNQRYLTKLEQQNLIEIEKKRRGRVSLTPEGRFAVKIFSPYYSNREKF
jgi:predicted transcriptional regulator